MNANLVHTVWSRYLAIACACACALATLACGGESGDSGEQSDSNFTGAAPSSPSTGAVNGGSRELKDLESSTDGMTVFADDATRALSKGDADFKVVLTALKLSQTPLSEDDLPPVAFCPSTIGVTLSGKGKPIANIGITCGEAPSDKNSVRVSLKSANAPELGLVINGRTLEKVAKKK